ncbi:MAG: hypothetical protein AAF252_06855 [Pseudomonadota bacterium]
MLVAALVFNLVILVPVIWGLSTGFAGMDAAFGPDGAARRVLTCVYGAIALASVALIALHSVAHPWAVPMTLALFGVQISYKLGTVWAVGFGNPVVITNVIVVVVQIIAIAVALRAGSLAA